MKEIYLIKKLGNLFWVTNSYGGVGKIKKIKQILETFKNTLLYGTLASKRLSYNDLLLNESI